VLVALEILAVVLVAVAAALALAHALELPGKLRLTRDEYRITQQIYYPGFTLGGAAEPLAVAALLALVLLVPPGAPFWLALAAFAGVLTMHAAYWLLTHPVNRFWLQGLALDRAGARFFAVGARRSAARGGADGTDGAEAEWTRLRDRWEYSHVVRAALGLAALALLAGAVAL
jgi:hypothetical protein